MQKNCEICNSEPAVGGAVINGTYYHSIGIGCKLARSGPLVNSGAARWNREIDYQDHVADILQPYAGGKPNPDFIAVYPEQAKKLFSEQELRDAQR